jgi:hypothetical protein
MDEENSRGKEACAKIAIIGSGRPAGAIAAGSRRVDWQGEAPDRIEAERREALPAARRAARGAWRDRRLMALAAHKQKAAEDIGE